MALPARRRHRQRWLRMLPRGRPSRRLRQRSGCPVSRTGRSRRPGRLTAAAPPLRRQAARRRARQPLQQMPLSPLRPRWRRLRRRSSLQSSCLRSSRLRSSCRRSSGRPSSASRCGCLRRRAKAHMQCTTPERCWARILLWRRSPTPPPPPLPPPTLPAAVTAAAAAALAAGRARRWRQQRRQRLLPTRRRLLRAPARGALQPLGRVRAPALPAPPRPAAPGAAGLHASFAPAPKRFVLHRAPLELKQQLIATGRWGPPAAHWGPRSPVPRLGASAGATPCPGLPLSEAPR